MTLLELVKFAVTVTNDKQHQEVVVVMPDDPTAIYAVQGIRFNETQNTVEVLVA